MSFLSQTKMGATEVEVKIRGAKDLKNVNWRRGDLKPYAVAWVHPDGKCSTKVDPEGDTCPTWDETLTLPLRGLPLDDAILAVDVVHAAGADDDDDTKPLVGSARLPLRDVLDDVGLRSRCHRTLKLKRPSGRPQGKLDLEVILRDELPPPPPPPPTAPAPAGYGYSPYSRDYAPPPVAFPYGASPSAGYPYGAPPSAGYPYGAPLSSSSAGYPYGAPPASAPPSYAAPPVGYPYGSGAAPAGYTYGYGAAPATYGYGRAEEGKKGSKFGMGTGLAVGAVAGALGGLALAEGVDALEDKIADDVAERVEDDLGYDDYGGGDF